MIGFYAQSTGRSYSGEKEGRKKVWEWVGGGGGGKDGGA